MTNPLSNPIQFKSPGYVMATKLLDLIEVQQGLFLCDMVKVEVLQPVGWPSIMPIRVAIYQAGQDW